MCSAFLLLLATAFFLAFVDLTRTFSFSSSSSSSSSSFPSHGNFLPTHSADKHITPSKLSGAVHAGGRAQPFSSPQKVPISGKQKSSNLLSGIVFSLKKTDCENVCSCFQTSSSSGETSTSSLKYTPRPSDSGRVMRCRATNPEMNVGVLEDSWTLDVQCKSHESKRTN